MELQAQGGQGKVRRSRQDPLIVHPTRMHEYPTEASRLAERRAGDRLTEARTLMVLSGGMALFLGVLIALFVVRYSTQVEARLSRE